MNSALRRALRSRQPGASAQASRDSPLRTSAKTVRDRIEPARTRARPLSSPSTGSESEGSVSVRVDSDRRPLTISGGEVTGGRIPLARAAQLGAPGRRARAPPAFATRLSLDAGRVQAGGGQRRERAPIGPDRPATFPLPSLHTRRSSCPDTQQAPGEKRLAPRITRTGERRRYSTSGARGSRHVPWPARREPDERGDRGADGLDRPRSRRHGPPVGAGSERQPLLRDLHDQGENCQADESSHGSSSDRGGLCTLRGYRRWATGRPCPRGARFAKHPQRRLARGTLGRGMTAAHASPNVRG